MCCVEERSRTCWSPARGWVRLGLGLRFRVGTLTDRILNDKRCGAGAHATSVRKIYSLRRRRSVVHKHPFNSPADCLIRTSIPCTHKNTQTNQNLCTDRPPHLLFIFFWSHCIHINQSCPQPPPPLLSSQKTSSPLSTRKATSTLSQLTRFQNVQRG